MYLKIKQDSCDRKYKFAGFWVIRRALLQLTERRRHYCGQGRPQPGLVFNYYPNVSETKSKSTCEHKVSVFIK